MRVDAQMNLASEKALGATDSDIQQARQRLNGTFSGMVVLAGRLEACNAIINQLAWVVSTPAVSDPKSKTP